MLAKALAAPPAAFGQNRETNRQALERLAGAVTQSYSYRDRLKIDWQKRFAEYEPRLLAARNNEEFARVAAELLGAARDVHLWLKVGERIVPTYQRNYQLNFNPHVLPRLIPELKQHGKTVLVGKFADGIRYVAIGTWDHREPESMQAAVAAVREAAKSQDPLVIDVRPNSGGDENLARQIAGFFVDQPTVYAKHVLRAEGKDSPVQDRVLQPRHDGPRHTAGCVVLMGPANISSCESFLLMMRAAGCTLVGDSSGGTSGNPKPHDLGNGVTVMLPSWRDLGLDGAEREGTGIAPDILVETSPKDFAMSDPVLIKALAHLRTKRSGD